MSPTPKILFLKQTASMHSWFVELGTDLAQVVGSCVMYTSVDADQQIGNLQLLASPAYSTRSDWSRLWTWFRYFVKALWLAWRTPHGALLFIVAQPPYLPLIGYMCKRFYGQRYMVWVDDVYPDALVRHGRLRESGVANRLWQRFNRKVLAEAEQVTTLGQRMAELVSQYLPDDAECKVQVIPTWVDSDIIQPISKSKNTFAIQHEQVDKLTVLYSGNLGLSHDLDTMIKAAERLQHLSKAHFMVIGAGTRWDELQTGAKRLDNLTLLPWQPEETLPYSLSAGDVAIVSLGKGFEGVSMPSKTQYAMAAGSAILGLSHSSSDIKEVIDRHNCGVNVEPGDVQGLVDAIVRFADDPEYLSRCRQNARQAAVAEYSRKVNVQRVLDVIRTYLDA